MSPYPLDVPELRLEAIFVVDKANQFEKIKEQLDAETADREDVNSLRFGYVLCSKFLRRGRIGYVSTGGAGHTLMYEGSWHASAGSDIPTNKYRLLSREERPKRA